MDPASTSKVGAPEELDEAGLLERLRAGDEAAFEELIRLFGGRMLAAAPQRGGNKGEGSLLGVIGRAAMGDNG